LTFIYVLFFDDKLPLKFKSHKKKEVFMDTKIPKNIATMNSIDLQFTYYQYVKFLRYFCPPVYIYDV